MAYGYSVGWTTKNHNAVPLNASKRGKAARIPGMIGAGKRIVPFTDIQEYRRQHEQDGVTTEQLCERTGHGIHTMRQWLRYITRVHA